MAAGSLIGSLAVSLGLETAAFNRGADQAETRAGKLQQRLARIGQGMTTAGVGLSAAVTAPFVALLSKAIPAATEARQALGQVEAAQRSMGNAAGWTTEQLQDQAGALMALSTFDDDEIMRKVTANLLTFGNIAGDVFERTQLAAVNMAARMGTDLQGATMMLGKALNDPLAGITKLSKAGIQFTDQQKAQIKAMSDAGDMAGAQRIMLGELERQFGGAAKALRDATPGADVKNQWDNFQETVGELALNLLPPLTAALTSVLTAFNSLPASAQATAVGALAVSAALGPLLLVLGPLTQAIGVLIGTLAAAAPVVMGWGAAAASAFGAAGLGGALSVLMAALGPALPLLAGLAAAAGAAYLVWQNWETIGPILQGLWDVIASTLGPPLIGLIEGVKSVLTALWEGPFGMPLRAVISVVTGLGSIFAETFGSALIGILTGLLKVSATVFGGIGDLLKVIAAVLRGDFAGAWEAAKLGAVKFALGIGQAISGMVGGVIQAIANMVTGIREWMVNRLNAVWDWVQRKIEAVKGFFKDLYVAVVGNSYVPDMVDGIAAEMARLDKAMVQPAQKAAKDTAQAFRDAAAEVGQLMDRLFPEARARLDMQRDLATIAKLPADQQMDARRRLYLQNGAIDNPVPIAGEVADGIGAIEQELPDFVEKVKQSTADVVKSFAEMGRDVLGSLRGMVDAFKGGDIIGGLLGLLDMVSQVAGMIGGNKGGQGGTPPGFGGSGIQRWANGGSAIIGGMAGTDRNLLSLNGLPLAYVSRGEHLSVMPSANDDGPVQVHVLPSPYFDAVVDGRAAAVAQPIGFGAALGGAALAQHGLLKQAGRKIP